MSLDLLKSEIARNSFTLVSSTVAAQAIPLLLHPVLRRIYSPENFGAFAVYLSIISIITIMASFRYEAAIVLPKNDIEAANIFSLTILINLIFCTLVMILILIFKNDFCSLIGFPVQYSIYLYLLPFSTMFFSFYQGINYWLIRKKAFRASAINKITRRGTEGFSQFLLGYKNFSFGLVIGDLVGSLSNLISGINQVGKNNFNFKYVTRKKMIFVMIKYKEFPLYNLFPSLLSTAATMLPFIFINRIYSTETVGYLDLSRLVLSIPLALISLTLAQVIFQRISNKKNHLQSIKRDLIVMLYFLLAIAVLEIAVILLWGPPLFGFVFGEKYFISGIYSQILVYSFVMNFIVSAYSSVFISLNKLKLYSIWQVSYFFLICCLLLFEKMELANFLTIYVAFEVVMSSAYGAMLCYVVMKYERSLKSNSSPAGNSLL